MPPHVRNRLALVVCLLLLLATAGLALRTRRAAGFASSRSTPQASAPLVVRPQEIVAAYQANASAADIKYKGKVLLLRGVVVSLNNTSFQAYLLLQSDKHGEGIQCMFDDKDTDSLAPLRVGQEITLTGRCYGYLDHVFMQDCSLR